MNSFPILQHLHNITNSPKAIGHASSHRRSDSLFYIETRYWTYIFAALTVVMLAVTFLF
jgi:hypothetical protein